MSDGTQISDKGFVPTLLLCHFLGIFGIHRFYVGKIGTGLLMLVTLGGFGIWTLIDLIMIIVGSFNDKQSLPIKPIWPDDAPVSEQGFVPALLLCYFVGVFGIHRFYVGKIGTGLLMLFTFGGFGIWTLIDLIMIVVGSFQDKQGLPVRAT